MKTWLPCDTIRIKSKRAICPVCGCKLPGIYDPGCVVKGVTLQCKRCHTKVRINIDNSDPRPEASSVQ